jgi:hypothetical protein
MQNEPNSQKSQMFITVVLTTNYNEKTTLDTWSKQTQTKPILSAPGGFKGYQFLAFLAFGCAIFVVFW